MTTPDECEKLYEESLWCLYALQDDLLQTGNPFMDEDRETIATCKWFIYFLAQYLSSFDYSRDQAHEASPCALPGADGHEPPRSRERRASRPEPSGCG